MKEDREAIKQRILNDIKDKTTISVSWLQREFGIGFSLAKEIYCEFKKTITE